jgi:hypothetical protein
MRVKEDRSGENYFSAAFGVIIIAIGLTWFLQAAGILPAGIRVLDYACPICVILFGVWIFMPKNTKAKNMQHEITEDTNVKM